jgi:hypothetical protein
MMGATAEHIALTSRDAGVDAVLPDAVRSHYERAIAAGHGKDSWTSLVEIIRKPRPELAQISALLSGRGSRRARRGGRRAVGRPR